jgi:hypothetical protein
MSKTIVFFQSEIDYLELLRELKNHYPGVIVNPVVETQSVLMRLTGNVNNEDSVVYPIEQQGELADKTAIALTKALLACCFFNNINLSRNIYGIEPMQAMEVVRRVSTEDMNRRRGLTDTEKALEKDFRTNTEEGFKRVAEGEKGLVQQEKETTQGHNIHNYGGGFTEEDITRVSQSKQETPIVQIGNKSLFYSNKAGVDARLLWTYPNTEEIRIFLRQIGTEPALDKEIKENNMLRVKKQGVIELLYGKEVLNELKRLEAQGYFQGELKDVRAKIKNDAGLLGNQAVTPKDQVTRLAENDEFEDDEETREIAPVVVTQTQATQPEPAAAPAAAPAPTPKQEELSDVSYLDTERKIKEHFAYYKMPMAEEDASSDRLETFEIIVEARGFDETMYQKLSNPACLEKYPSLDIMATTAPLDYFLALKDLAKEWATRKKIAES